MHTYASYICCVAFKKLYDTSISEFRYLHNINTIRRYCMLQYQGTLSCWYFICNVIITLCQTYVGAIYVIDIPRKCLWYFQWDTLYHKTYWQLSVISCCLNIEAEANDRHFPDDIFKCIFLNENVLISIKISLKFVLKRQINNIPALV